MQMLNQFKLSNRVKKSQVLTIGSLFIFVGFIFLTFNYFLKLRDEVYSDMKIAMMDDEPVKIENVVEEAPVLENVEVEEEKPTNYVVDYSKYFGVLEIPKIGLKRGFYNVDNRYNNIQYNVTMANGSTMPDVHGGNLILMAHSGDAYISYFAYLWRLNIGDSAFVTYNGYRYEYRIVDIYEVPKNGIVRIRRNLGQTTLTMITCTKNNDYTQTVYISELVG
ncbi:MAG: sortase [Bacilli bacterium]|nr:sortase [Bacilli bacterium]MBR1936960.1 sortase [Bacilli bacterium]